MRYIATEDKIIALDNIERVECTSQYGTYDCHLKQNIYYAKITIRFVGGSHPTEIEFTSNTEKGAIAARKKAFNEIMEELKAVKISC